MNMDNIFLLKFGGNAIKGKEDLDRLSKEIALLKKEGAKIVLVHGGGPEINAELERLGIVPKKIAGERVTDDKTMEVVEKVLREINYTVVASMQSAEISVVGIPGYFVTLSENKGPHKVFENGEEIVVDLINVGKVVDVNPDTIYDLLNQDITPVIYPVGADKDGNYLNVNADEMASGIAAGIKCKEMVQITDVPGILLDINDANSLQKKLTLSEVDDLIKKGIISGGMIPKVEACRTALNAGVEKVRMVNGKNKESIVSNLMKDGFEFGTLIVKG